jgi:hypothetical protein
MGVKTENRSVTQLSPTFTCLGTFSRDLRYPLFQIAMIAARASWFDFIVWSNSSSSQVGS